MGFISRFCPDKFAKNVASDDNAVYAKKILAIFPKKIIY